MKFGWFIVALLCNWFFCQLLLSSCFIFASLHLLTALIFSRRQKLFQIKLDLWMFWADGRTLLLYSPECIGPHDRANDGCKLTKRSKKWIKVLPNLGPMCLQTLILKKKYQKKQVRFSVTAVLKWTQSLIRNPIATAHLICQRLLLLSCVSQTNLVWPFLSALHNISVENWRSSKFLNTDPIPIILTSYDMKKVFLRIWESTSTRQIMLILVQFILNIFHLEQNNGFVFEIELNLFLRNCPHIFFLLNSRHWLLSSLYVYNLFVTWHTQSLFHPFTYLADEQKQRWRKSFSFKCLSLI